MATKQEFKAPEQSVYGTVVQSAENGKKAKKEYYRFNLKLPMECKDYLQEMAWRNRTTITEYLTDLVESDIKAHPNWKDTLDILNK